MFFHPTYLSNRKSVCLSAKMSIINNFHHRFTLVFTILREDQLKCKAICNFYMWIGWDSMIFFSFASKPINIRRIITGTEPYWTKVYRVSYHSQFFADNIKPFHFTIRGKLSIIWCDKQLFFYFELHIYHLLRYIFNMH